MTIGYEYRPGTLYLNVTNRCSNACTFCVRQGAGFSLAGFDMRLEREPATEEVREAIERLQHPRAVPFGEIVFCGFGEPTYRLGLVGEVGRELRRQGRRVRLNTNGQAALIAGCDPLPCLAGALDEVSISLNAPDSSCYEELCRPRFGPLAFPTVLEFARRSTMVFEQVTLSAVRFTLTEEQGARCAELATEIGATFRWR